MTKWLDHLFSSGWISGVAILVLWLVTLVATRTSPQPRQTLALLTPNAISGSALLAAFGLAMRGADLLWLALLLAVSLLAFLADLRIRLTAQASGLRRRTE